MPVVTRIAGLTFTALAVVLPSAWAVAAGETKPFLCEVEGGYYSPHNLKGVERSMSARIAFTKIHRHPKWEPAAGLLFVLPGKQQYAGVQVYVRHGRSHELLIGMWTPKGGQAKTFAKTGARTPVDVEVTLDEEGRLTATVAGISKTVRIKQSAIERRIAMCSSGAFTFEKLSAAVE